MAEGNWRGLPLEHGRFRVSPTLMRDGRPIAAVDDVEADLLLERLKVLTVQLLEDDDPHDSALELSGLALGVECGEPLTQVCGALSSIWSALADGIDAPRASTDPEQLQRVRRRMRQVAADWLSVHSQPVRWPDFFDSNQDLLDL